MTENRALKQNVRRRMKQTGEKYTEARRALATPVGELEPGELRVVVVAWHLDDPAIKGDARFWFMVPAEAADLFEASPATIIPKGKPLAYWGSLPGVARGDEIELPNPYYRQPERLSLARWGEEDPDRTHVTIQFLQGGQPLDDVAQGGADRLPTPAPTRREETRRAVTPKLSDDARRLKAEQADLQREYRAARELGDTQPMANLSRALDAKAAELSREAFPNFSRGWDFSRAIREPPNRFIFDWTTGY